MRLVLFLVLALGGLAACEEPGAAPGVETPGAAAPDAALKSAAARECAQMTGYAPEKLAKESAELRALVEREFKSCVAKVTAGDPPP